MKSSANDIFEKIEAYAVGTTLIDSDVEYLIKENDYDIYDSWDYDNPPCHSLLMANKKEKTTFKISKNKRDGEIILAIRDNDEFRRKLCHFIYNQFKNMTRRESGVSVYYQENDDGTFRFEGFFLGHNNYVLNIVINYIKKTLEDRSFQKP